MQYSTCARGRIAAPASFSTQISLHVHATHAAVRSHVRVLVEGRRESLYVTFKFVFVAAVIAFLAVEGIALALQERRIRRLEEQTWKVRLKHE